MREFEVANILNELKVAGQKTSAQLLLDFRLAANCFATRSVENNSNIRSDTTSPQQSKTSNDANDYSFPSSGQQSPTESFGSCVDSADATISTDSSLVAGADSATPPTSVLFFAPHLSAAVAQDKVCFCARR